MAVYTEQFQADGSNKIFTAMATILSESHVRVDYYYEDVQGQGYTDHKIANGSYDIINNSVVLQEAPDASYTVKVTVSTDGEGLEPYPSVITTVSTFLQEIDTVAGIKSDVTTVSGIHSDVTTVSGIHSDVTIVATNIAKVNTVATDIAKVIKVADDLNEAISEVETVANDLNETTSEIEVVANNIANVNIVGGVISDVTTVANIEGKVVLVAAIDGNVTTVANNDANVTTAATNMPAILAAPVHATTATTKANDSANSATASANSATSSLASKLSSASSASASASSASSASTSASTATAQAGISTSKAAIATTKLASFEGQYKSQATAPTSPIEGQLWFDTTNNLMKVYDGSGFVNAGSSVNGVNNSVEHTAAAAGQTVFNATYDAGYLDVYMNGALLAKSDYTATDGATVTLSVGASVNDVIFIQSFGTFEVADVYTKGAADTKFMDINAETLPDQTGSNGKYLSTDGTSASWNDIIGGGPSLGTDSIIRTNANVINEDITIPAGTNGSTVGTVTIGTGYTVTVNGRWVVL